jgi:lipopolysaccharide/colanic/teichoic acid biosynthesis glycosyltransferase
MCAPKEDLRPARGCDGSSERFSALISDSPMKPLSLNRWILFADLAWSVAALFLAEVLRYGAFWRSADRAPSYALLPFLAAAAVLWIFLSLWMRLDCFRGGWRFPAVVSQVFLAVLCLVSVVLSAGYLRRDYVSRLALSYFGILLFVGFVGIRYIARLLLLAKHHSGNVRRVVIVGTDRVARELAAKIRRHPETLCQVVGFLGPEDDGNASSQDSESAVTVTTLGVVGLLTAHRVSDVILALPNPSLPEVLNLAGLCRERGIGVSFVPQPYELYLSKPTLLELDGIPVLELREASASSFFFQCKRFTDIVLGSVLLVAAIPVLLPAAIGLHWTKGRTFRRETRCGRHGKVFSILRLNVDRHSSNATQFERMLENMSLTELPQLWNVLRGEMSLVGPRPESPDRVTRYSEWQQQRLSIKPGMTGLAQVHGLRDQNSSEEKTRFDLQYILNPSAVADVSILLQTLWTLAVRLFRYPEPIGSASNVQGSKLFDEVTPDFVEETIQGAHRSQPSAD